MHGKVRERRESLRWRAVLLASGLLAACAVSPLASEQPAEAQDAKAAATATISRFDLGQPYLGGPLPGGERLIHPAPETGSSRMVADEEANASALSMRDGARWDLAARDADLGENWYGHAFSCAAGVEISPDKTPHIANLLRRAGSDFGMSTGAVKRQFQRTRPFVVNGQASCTPQDEPFLKDNGSYPSGHSAMGYGTGLVLASLFPERAALLVARGRAYGNSRWICNVHWLSDVEEGRAFAVATFARLEANIEFRADFVAAQEEARALYPIKDEGNCAAEAEALGH